MYNILHVKMHSGGVPPLPHPIHNHFKNVSKVKCSLRSYGVYKGIKHWEKLELYFYIASFGHCRKYRNTIHTHMKCQKCIQFL